MYSIIENFYILLCFCFPFYFVSICLCVCVFRGKEIREMNSNLTNFYLKFEIKSLERRKNKWHVKVAIKAKNSNIPSKLDSFRLIARWYINRQYVSDMCQKPDHWSADTEKKISNTCKKSHTAIKIHKPEDWRKIFISFSQHLHFHSLKSREYSSIS